MYKIEKGFPLPPKKKLGGHRERRYDWHGMIVGDSFFVPDNDVPQGAVESSVRSMNMRSRKQYVSQRDATGIRVWRIA